MGVTDGEAAPRGGPPNSIAPRQARPQNSTPLKFRRYYVPVNVPGEIEPLVRAWVRHWENRRKLQGVAAADRWSRRLGYLAELEARIAARGAR